MPAATVRAQAKINLFLRITGREASGYHHLETLFCRLALADEVTVRLTSSLRTLDCIGPALPPQGLGAVAENLAWRAALGYTRQAHWPAGFEILLEKHIPARAGLGGGSADAGAVLRALNALNPRPLEKTSLQQLAASLGADVPFLTQDSAAVALAWGRGDHLRSVTPLPERPCLVAIPAVGVATADAYGWIDEKRGWVGREVSVADPSGYFDSLSWDSVARCAHNDFEEVVFQRFPAIAHVASWLRGHPSTEPGSIVLLSGSGAAVFVVPAPARGVNSLAHHGPPGVQMILTTTAERVESVRLID